MQFWLHPTSVLKAQNLQILQWVRQTNHCCENFGRVTSLRAEEGTWQHSKITIIPKEPSKSQCPNHISYRKHVLRFVMHAGNAVHGVPCHCPFPRTDRSFHHIREKPRTPRRSLRFISSKQPLFALGDYSKRGSARTLWAVRWILVVPEMRTLGVRGLGGTAVPWPPCSLPLSARGAFARRSTCSSRPVG